MFKNYLIIVLVVLSSAFCQKDTEAKEFEENEIKSDFHQFIFETDRPAMIIVIVKNENLNQNSFDFMTLTTFNKITRKSEEFNLSSIKYIILEDAQNQEKAEYILKFKNYIGGKFVIYNSANDYPLKDLEKGYNFQYYFPSSDFRNINLTFATEILNNDILLDVYPGEKMNIIKILDSGNEKLEIKNNSIILPKNFKYRIEFFKNSYQIEVAINKRKIINYKINDEVKLDLSRQIPFFFLLNIAEYDAEIIYSYLYCIYSFRSNISIAELESENISDWNSIEFYNTSVDLSSYKIKEINIKKVSKSYLLIKYALTNDINKNNIGFFYTFKIFQNFRRSTPLYVTPKEKEALIIKDINSNYMMFTTSNISNLRTFENKESRNFIYQRELFYFSYIIKPTSEICELNTFQLYYSLTGEIYYKEIFFHNDLSFLFNNIVQQKIWLFDINDNYTFIVKSDFGFPKIYYIDEISEKNIDDLSNQRFENFKQINASNNILKFNSLFALYIQPYEGSYLNIIFNKDDNLNILKEASNKYLIANQEYQLMTPSKLFVRIDKDFDSNINILDREGIIFTLNKENPSFKINSYDVLFFKSEKNTLINFYYNISVLFFNEPVDIITFPLEKKGEIMIVKILSYESNDYFYAFDYGYDYFISPDTKKISTTQTYFFIDDPYSKMNEKNEDLRYYLILFNQNIKYEISFKKKYEKQNNSSYYLIESKENYAVISDSYYPNSGITYEILLCDNKNINLTITDVNNKTELITTNKLILKGNGRGLKYLFTFEAKSKFLFSQIEHYVYIRNTLEIEYYIPNIEDGKISLLIFNNFLDKKNKYTIIVVEDKNNDDNLMNNIDNECFLFSLINGDIENISYIIQKDSTDDGRYFYTELNFSKFSNSKYLLIKILSCENEINMCIFSKTQRIYLENLVNDKEEEFGVKKIEEFTEYNITRQDYIFSYEYKPYLDNIGDIILYIAVPKTGDNYVGEIEVINPLMQNFTFKYRYTETIPLIKGQHVTSRGKYYFIFRDCVGVTFYVHNTIRFFPLNKINNYISETSHMVSNGINYGLLYFTMNLEEDRYIFLKFSSGNLYLYNITDRAIKLLLYTTYDAYKIQKGSYILILEYGGNNNYQFMFNINHFIVDLEKSKEIKVEMGTKDLWEPTVAAVVDLSKYNNSLYLVSDSTHLRFISCEKSMDIEQIIKNAYTGNTYMSSHIENIYERKRCNPPYYNIKFYTTRFELVSDVYEIYFSKNLSFQQKDTIAITVEGNGYNLILSNQENMKWLDQMENEFVNVILSNTQIQFKLKPNENIQTNLQIIILENKNGIKIETLTNKEISTKFKYNTTNKEFKYYINLSKNKYIINHFDYIGKLEFYISKDEINGNILKQILTGDDINMNSFDKVANSYFELDNNKILIMKKENEIYSELLMTPLIHDFIIENTNTKYLIANKRYFIRSYCKILLEENSDAKIKVYDLNNTEIYTIDKNNSFENIDYNKLLFLKSDKNDLIYIYQQINENSKIFEPQKANNNSVLILSSSDCAYDKLEYTNDYGFNNYISFNQPLTELVNSQIIIPLKENSDIKIHKGLNHIIYMQCSDKALLLRNSSGFYENSISIESNGSYIIEKNDGIFIHNILDDIKNNIFYQIFKCESSSNNELYASIDDDNELIKLSKNDNFISGKKDIYFYIKNKDEFLFNSYKTSLNKNDYTNIEKNEEPYFKIIYISKNLTKIDILPKFKNIDFEFYFFMYIDKENKILDNPLNNKCYLKKLIDNNNTKLNEENIIIKKIEYKNGNITDNIIETPNLEIGFKIYSNVFGLGKIFEDVEEYVFYTEQNHIIVDTDFPSDENSDSDDPKIEPDNGGLSLGAIIGIVIGSTILLLIIVFLILKFRKKNSVDLENDNKYSPLTLENQD